MKKVIILTLLLMGICSNVFAADWSKYTSGRLNITLEGTEAQPGYIEFQDGSGTTIGYLWMSSDRGLLWCTAGAIDLTTTKLSNSIGQRVSTQF